MLFGLGDPSRAAIVSDEIQIDPGYRFFDYTEPSFPQIAIKGDTLGVVASDINGYGARIYPRDLMGGELAMSPKYHNGDVHDAVWEDEGLWVLEGIRNSGLQLSRYTSWGAGAPTYTLPLVDGRRDEYWDHEVHPRLHLFGDEIWVSWIDVDVELRRLTRDGQVIAEYGWPALGGVYGLSTTDDEALLVWPDIGSRLACVRFGADGEPLNDGEPEFYTASQDLQRTAVAHVDGNWLVVMATEYEIQVAVLDATELSIRSTFEGFSNKGLQIEAGDGNAMLAWRGWSTSSVVTLDSNGRPNSAPIELATKQWWRNAFRPSHQVDIEWTGEHFIALMPSLIEEHTGPPCETGNGSEEVRGFWFDGEGQPLSEEGVVFNQTYVPAHGWSHFTEGQFLQLMNDRNSRGYQLARMTPGSNGFEVVNHRTIAGSRCSESMYPRSAVAAGRDLLVSYVYSYDNWYWNSGYSAVDVYRLSPTGSWSRLFRIQDKSVHSESVDGDDQTAWLASITSTPSELPSATVMVDHKGTQREWAVPALRPQSVRIAGTSEDALVVWANTDHGRPDDVTHLYYARLFPDRGDDPINGTRVFDNNGWLPASYRIERSPDSEVLFCMRNDGEGNKDLYTVHFGPHGPGYETFVHSLGNYRHFDVIWSGSRYFVCWTSQDGDVSAIWLREDGTLSSADPVHLFEHQGPIDLSSDGQGTIGMAYAGNRFRTVVEDPSPVLVSGLTAEWRDGVEVSWMAHGREPAAFEVLRKDSSEAQGISVAVVASREGHMSVWDPDGQGLEAPVYQLLGHFSDGHSAVLGNVIPELPGEEQSPNILTLEVKPNPVIDGTIVAHLAVPPSLSTERIELAVYDVAGRLLHREDHEGLGNATISIAPAQTGVTTGLYFVRLSSKSGVVTRPVTILAR